MNSSFYPIFHAVETITIPTLQMSKLKLIQSVLNARLVVLEAQH